jgi:Ca-activated chloride channel family protein
MSFPCGSDPWLDARLRNIPLPPGMLARLHDTVDQLAAETETTAATGGAAAVEGPKLFRPNSPVPLGEVLSNEQMDRLLVDVGLPPGLVDRLERISRESRRRLRPRTVALAASVMLAVGVAYAWRATVFSILPDVGTGNIAIQQPEVPPTDQPSHLAGGTREADVPTIEFADTLPSPAIDELRWRLMQEANPSVYAPEGVVRGPAPVPLIAKQPVRSKHAIFASDRTLDQLPELETVAWDAGPRGVAVPLVAGYDLRFQSRFGQHPFVVPETHPRFRTLNIPLTSATSSYDLAWQQLAQGKLPAAHQVRVEDFLAAFDYQFAAAPAGAVALRTAGGPAPWSRQGTQLLQVGVQAGPLLPLPRRATKLIVVVDTSASMRREGRLAMVRRGLAELASALAAGDRLSLVSTSDTAQMVTDSAGRDQLTALLSAIEHLHVEDATNLGAGIELAAQAALAEPSDLPDQTCRVVVLTDALPQWEPAERDRLLQLAGELSTRGTTLDVIRVDCATPADRDVWQPLAEATGGDYRSLATFATIRQRLMELLEGRSQRIASDASLSITFNPKAVAAYRLLGHESPSLTGASPAPLKIDLHAGQSATALIELKLRPLGGDEIATAELTWQDPTSGEERRARQPITRLQFAKLFAESPLSLQTAALAAYTAELLRGSQFTGGKSLSSVWQLAEQGSPLVWQSSEVKALLAFVDAAERVRLRGSRARASSPSATGK